MKKILGITGGVGAGKTTVLNIIKEEFRAEIINTDELAQKLMEPGTEVHQRIVDAFDTNLEDEDGFFDKKLMSDLVFGNPDATAIVNGIVHPAVTEEVKRLIEASKRHLVCIESALLIEAGLTSLCDEVWYVYVSVQDRVKRLYEQRGYDEVKSYQIMFKQLDHEEFSRACNRTIDNGFSKAYTRRQIREFGSALLGIELTE